MSRLNFEITLYHTPYIENLLTELQSVINQKRTLYRNVKSESDFHKKLTFEEREIIKHLTLEEERILLKLIDHKGWTVNTNQQSEKPRESYPMN